MPFMAPVTNTMGIGSPSLLAHLCHCQVASSGFAEENVEQSPDHRKLNVWKPRAALAVPPVLSPKVQAQQG